MVARDRISFLVALVCALCLAACAGGPPKDIVIKGDVVAAADVNPDYQGRASPVVVIVYQLKNADAFMAGGFFSLYDADSSLLADSLIARQQIQMQPGETRQFDSEFDPETRFIGVVAAFREIENAQFRAIAEIPEKKLTDIVKVFKKDRLQIQVDRLAVAVTIGKPK